MKTGWSISFQSTDGRAGGAVEGRTPGEALQPRVNPEKMPRLISNLIQGWTNSLDRRPSVAEQQLMSNIDR